MLKVLLASNDTAYMKDLINLALGNNLNIKIVSVVSKVQEVLNTLKNHHEIDLLLLDISILGKNPIKFLESIEELLSSTKTKAILLSGKINFSYKLLSYSFIIDFFNKSDKMSDIAYRLMNVINAQKNEEVLRKISDELTYIGYNSSHLGFQYIKECILEIYTTKDFELIHKLENTLYKRIASKHHKSPKNIKTNIIKATNYMYLESDMSLLKEYFHFSDDKKPTAKIVISTILNKLSL